MAYRSKLLAEFGKQTIEPCMLVRLVMLGVQNQVHVEKYTSLLTESS